MTLSLLNLQDNFEILNKKMPRSKGVDLGDEVCDSFLLKNKII